MTIIVAFRRIMPVIVFGVIPLLSLLTAFVTYSHSGSTALDFHHELYPEAKLVWHGHNPYPPANADLSDGTNNIWPIAAVIPIMPLTLLPAGVADWVMTVLALGCLAAALWVLDVRDWRIYGTTLLWPPVISAYQTANVTLPLCLLCALAWKHRDHRWRPGVMIGVALAVKFFLWPLVFWLASIRRMSASLISVTLAGASLLLILPFTSIGAYIDLIRNLGSTFDDKGYTFYALLVDVGISSPVARIVTIGIGCMALALAWRRRSLGLAIGAALILSPIVWLHFFALLIVPMALAYPRFSAAWLLALPMWLVPGTENGVPWQTALALATLLAILAAGEIGNRQPSRVHLGRAAPTVAGSV